MAGEEIPVGLELTRALAADADKGDSEDGPTLGVPGAVAIGAGALAIISLGVSIGLSVWVKKQDDDQQALLADMRARYGDPPCALRLTVEQNSDCEHAVENLDRRNGIATATNVMWGVTGALGLAAAAFGAWEIAVSSNDAGPDSSRLRVSPHVGIGCSGAHLMLRW